MFIQVNPKRISARVKDPSGNLKEVQFQYYGPSDTDWQDIGSAVSVIRWSRGGSNGHKGLDPG